MTTAKGSVSVLSVVIIAKNEEANIRRCLESVQWADEIIVLDSGSTDNTVPIAKEYTPHVVCTDWQGYGIQKQRALSHASQEWVLNIDADESVDSALKKEMVQAMQSTRAEAYRIPIRMNFYGKPLRYSSSPSRHIRLFKREGAFYSTEIVHEKIVLPDNARVGRLKSPIMHHSFQDVSHAIYKLNRYSSYTAKIRIQKQKTTSFSKIMVGSCWMFFRCYFLQRGLLDGKAGFIFALYNAQGTWYRGIKQLFQDMNLEQLPDTRSTE